MGTNQLFLAIAGAVAAHFVIEWLKSSGVTMAATPASATTPPATVSDAEVQSETMV